MFKKQPQANKIKTELDKAPDFKDAKLTANEYRDFLQKIGGANIKPVPFFVKSNSEMIDLRTPTPEQIGASYLKSFDKAHFSEVMVKNNTIDNIYLGNIFNEWLINIDNNLFLNKSYDPETQLCLKDFNKYLCSLSNNIIQLYKQICKFTDTNDEAFITTVALNETKVVNEINLLNYTNKIKVAIEFKDYQKANDIKTYCLRLLKYCTENLNEVLLIDITKSPLNIHFSTLINSIENSINVELETAIQIKNLNDAVAIKEPQPKTPELNNDTAPKTPKDYKEAIWFTTGIKLATGEAYELYKKQKNFTVLTKELGFKESDRPYFSATIQNNDSDKNTFANPGKIKKLHQHLTENNLKFGAEFLAKYNKIEPE